MDLSDYDDFANFGRRVKITLLGGKVIEGRFREVEYEEDNEVEDGIDVIPDGKTKLDTGVLARASQIARIEFVDPPRQIIS